MTAKTQSVAVRFLPSLTDVAFIVPLIFQFKQLGGAPTLLADGDTGWHLRTGEWILAHGHVPQQDMFSYTHAGQPWFAWEWLWDVSFGFLNQHFGLAAVVAVSMLLICLTSAMLYRLVLRKCPNPFIAILVTVLAAAGASIHWLARPHLFTLFFTVVFLHILDRVYVDGRRKLLWLLPPLTILWTNIHGGFVAGLIILAAYAGGGLLSAIIEPAREVRSAILNRVKPYVLCGILCGLATLVNPYFTGLHQHIVTYLLDPYLYAHITEFLSFDFGHPAARYIEVLMALSAAAVCWNLYRRRFEYAVLLAGWLHLGLHVRRNVPLFSIICAPLVAEALYFWLRDLQASPVAAWIKTALHRFDESGARIGSTDRLPRLHLASAAAMAFVAALLYAPQPPAAFVAKQDPKYFPVAAANLLARDGDDRIFTSDIWGGYLIYRLFPKSKVFIDGRSDFYGSAFELKYLDMVGAKYDWDQNLEHYGARTALLPADAPLASALKENPRWQVAYDDGVAIVFRRTAGSFASVKAPSQQVSKCLNPGGGEGCGAPAAAVSSLGNRTVIGSASPKKQLVAETSPPRLPLLNRP